jgi:hypothetical protein
VSISRLPSAGVITRIPGMGTVETHFAFGQVKRTQVFPGFT